ncbi:FkbM family methyltransferase [Brevundimonas sp. C43]|uniref:FkbM family methyltransferase n=1 Tax=Brevundimonas TaxID=41275 RepID=UPI00273DF711|nr:FkbM family methyltransferase [Brevundimonas sp. C43]
MPKWPTSVSRFLRPTIEPQRPYFYLGEGLALTQLMAGPFVYVDPLEESVCPHLIAQGTWEAWIAKVVLDLLQPGDKVVEVGGHVGFYTLLMAQKVGPQGSVLTFEANPRLAALATRSVRFNGYSPWVRIVRQAVSDTEGWIKFSVSRQYGGGGHVYVLDDALGDDTQVLEVESVRLDSLGLSNIRLLRIDAEGSEPLILAGAKTLLQQPDIVLCIEWDVIQMRSRQDPQILVDQLVGCGFKFWRITTQSELVLVDNDALTNLPSCDLVVARRHPLEPR